MIVCHCNVLTDVQIVETFARPGVSMPRSPAAVHRCLGCAPDCGRCLVTIRQMLRDAAIGCEVGCPACPARATVTVANDDTEVRAAVFAAE
jgi:bacterioferritin-associated ferredoxin